MEIESVKYEIGTEGSTVYYDGSGATITVRGRVIFLDVDELLDLSDSYIQAGELGVF